jgi:hypothetical protein
VVAGVCTLFMRPSRLVRGHRPETLHARPPTGAEAPRVPAVL